MSNRRGGLFFGVIMGTILGVLFAPKKGKELRTQLKKEIDKGGIGTETLKDNFIAMGQDMADTAHDIYEQPQVKDTIDKGQKYVKKVMKQAKGKINEVESQAKEMGSKYYAMGKEKMGQVKEKVDQVRAKVEDGIHAAKDTIMSDIDFKKRAIRKGKNGRAGAAKKRQRKIDIEQR